MKRSLICLSLLVLLVVAACSAPAPEPETTAPAEEEPKAAALPAPSADEQIYEMEVDCANNKKAIEIRQSESSLIERLGGREGIETLFAETMRLHAANEQIGHLFADIDAESVVKHATDFLIAGSGGDAEYTGRDVVALHAPMEISGEDFLAAGADFEMAMDKLSVGADERQEVMCALVSLRGMVMATEAAEEPQG